MTRPHSRRHPQSGFSMVEMLLAMMIMVIVLTVLFPIVLTSNRVSKLLRERTFAIQTARSVLSRIATELRSTPEIVTEMPDLDDDPTLPKVTEIMFQEGNQDVIQYVRYYRSGPVLRRQTIAYYFSSDPTEAVYWDDTDELELPPYPVVVSDYIVGTNVTRFVAWNEAPVFVQVQTTSGSAMACLSTEITCRNALAGG